MALIAALSITLAGGCGTAPVQDDTRLLAQVSAQALARAEALASGGDPDAAAAAYVALARAHRPPARNQLLIRALQIRLDSGDIVEAQALLGQISRPDLQAAQRQTLLWTEAELALIERRPDAALGHLQQIPAWSLTAPLRARRLGLMADAHRLAGRPFAAADALRQLGPLLPDERARRMSQVSLIATLTRASEAELAGKARHGSDALRGWAQLALLARDHANDPETFAARARSGAAPDAPPELARAYAAVLWGTYRAQDRVVALLPLAGRFAGAGAAVRGGIEGADRVNRGGGRPDIQFLDSTEPGLVGSDHARAVAAHASHIIGPLQKEAVDVLTSKPAAARPTLTLNQGTRTRRSPANLLQFALSPEAEAEEAAARVLARGCRRALMLYPEAPWGERLANAFDAHWRRLGAPAPGRLPYEAADGIAERLAGRPADCAFLVATGEAAQRIYPALRDALPASATVIATSHVYSGQPDATRDRLLDGLYFVDIPWMLDLGGSGPLSRRGLDQGYFDVSGPLVRLFAMGIDAYQLAPRLSDFADTPGAYHAGQTGGLWVDPLGRVQRQLALGRFRADRTERDASSAAQGGMR